MTPQQINLSPELLAHAAATHCRRTVWEVTCNDNTHYKRRVSAQRAMGTDTLQDWLDGIVKRWGYPILVQRWDIDPGPGFNSILEMEVALRAPDEVNQLFHDRLASLETNATLYNWMAVAVAGWLILHQAGCFQ